MYDWLERAAARRPRGIAIDHPAGSLTYEELRSRAAERHADVRPGERVALPGDDAFDFAISLHAVLSRGATAVPLDPRLSLEERDFRAGAPFAVEPGTATMMFTSGTTSAPKPVYLTLGNWEANAIGSALALGLDLKERWLCTMPLAHVGGLSILLRSTFYATTVVLHDRFETEAVLHDLMSAERAVTVVSLVPTMLARLLDAGLWNPPSLRWALLGGGPIPAPLMERAAAAGVPVAWTYGMTEACSQIATFGFPLHGVELRIVDDEVQVRGGVVSPAALADDGWLHTGDLGELDTEGRLRIIGRRSETIVSGGENIAPTEVEEVLLEHPAVADVAVFARRDEHWGERVVATVVLRVGQRADPDELKSFVGERLARFKVPKEIEFSERLPRTVSGKLLRRELV